jgi:hypothetical protein
VAFTCTVGGAISGYCSMGNDIKPNIPRMVMRIEITVERTGLSINTFNILIKFERYYFCEVAV